MWKTGQKKAIITYLAIWMQYKLYQADLLDEVFDNVVGSEGLDLPS